MKRRALLSTVGLLPLLAGCLSTSNRNATVTVPQVQEYTNDLVNALSAAGLAYINTTPPPSAVQITVVQTVINGLQSVNRTVQSVTAVPDLRSAVLEGVALANQLSPLVTPFLGPAAPYVPIAIAVLQAFVQSLPAPADAPQKPPVALHRVGLTYHPHH